jgi:hypothetical protein
MLGETPITASSCLGEQGPFLTAENGITRYRLAQGPLAGEKGVPFVFTLLRDNSEGFG